MAKIEFDLVDFDYFSNDIKTLNDKLDEMKSFVNSNFKKEKKNDLYVSGFNKIVKYLETEKDRLTKNQSVLIECRDAMNDVETKYKSSF